VRHPQGRPPSMLRREKHCSPTGEPPTLLQELDLLVDVGKVLASIAGGTFPLGTGGIEVRD